MTCRAAQTGFAVHRFAELMFCDGQADRGRVLGFADQVGIGVAHRTSAVPLAEIRLAPALFDRGGLRGRGWLGWGGLYLVRNMTISAGLCQRIG